MITIMAASGGTIRGAKPDQAPNPPETPQTGSGDAL